MAEKYCLCKEELAARDQKLADLVTKLESLRDRIGSTYSPFKLDEKGNRVYLTAEEIGKEHARWLDALILSVKKGETPIGS